MRRCASAAEVAAAAAAGASVLAEKAALASSGSGTSGTPGAGGSQSGLPAAVCDERGEGERTRTYAENARPVPHLNQALRNPIDLAHVVGDELDACGPAPQHGNKKRGNVRLCGGRAVRLCGRGATIFGGGAQPRRDVSRQHPPVLQLRDHRRYVAAIVHVWHSLLPGRAASQAPTAASPLALQTAA